MTHIIIPSTYLKTTSQLIFLAGPTRGAPPWQAEAIEFLASYEHDMDLTIASPERSIPLHMTRLVIEGDQNYFHRRRAWERYYLDVASKIGAILFWLPGEQQHNCDKVYGATTRLELGQWMVNYRHDNSVRFCIGIDHRFPDVDAIIYDLSVDAPDKPVFETLEETCIEALRIVGAGP
ncbi:MAG: hypothetical protein C5B51_14770 [Terriglobia bacterium]|nr:MAG: hypothetical protein C5B51_14770 [Terriglobia bacterium]